MKLRQINATQFFTVMYIRRFYQVIFFPTLHCRVSARLFVVILKGFSASPLDKLFRVSLYFIKCSPLFPYGLVCQKVPCTSKSISGSQRSRSPSFQPGWDRRAHGNTQGWRLSFAQQTLVNNIGAKNKRARDVRGSVFPFENPFLSLAYIIYKRRLSRLNFRPM